MAQDGDDWVEIDGCLEHPDGGRVFRVMLRETEAWFARNRKSARLAGPLAELRFAKHLGAPGYWMQEPGAWKLTAENRKADINPHISSVFYEPSSGVVQIWKIDIQGAPPFWVLTRDGAVEISYTAKTYEAALVGAYYLWKYGRVEDSRRGRAVCR